MQLWTALATLFNDGVMLHSSLSQACQFKVFEILTIYFVVEICKHGREIQVRDCLLCSESRLKQILIDV